MAGEWRTCQLGDVIELKRGYDLPAAQRRPGDIPIVSSSGETGTHHRAMARGPGVVTGRYGTIGEVFYVDRDFWPLNTTLYVRDFKGAIPRFVAYFLRTVDFRAYSDKAAVPGVNRNHLHQACVSWPPLRDQESIVNLLGALDDKIELNRRIVETLEAMTHTLFQSWFVDFDQVRAKAEGRPTGLPDDLAALFPDSFNVDELPEGWTFTPLNELAWLERTTMNPTALGQELVDHFSLPAFDAGALPSSENATTIKSLKLDLAPPLVLFSKLNPEISRVWPVITKSDRPMLASTEFLALKPRPERATLAYLASLLSSETFRDRAAGMVTGTSKSHQRVQPTAILESVWPTPDAAILAAFDLIVAPILSRIERLRCESETLASTRDTLLPRLLSRELRVAEAERDVAAA